MADKNQVLRTYTVSVLDLTVEVRVKRIKNMYLRVMLPKGQVVVSASPRVKPEQVQDMVLKHIRMVRSAQARLQKPPVARAPQRSLAEMAKLATEMELALFARLRVRYEVAVGAPHLRFKQMRSLWGSYSRKTNGISLNTELAKYDLCYLRYVVAHELAHVVEYSHNQRFKDVLTYLLPDWRPLNRAMAKFRLG